MVHAVDEKKTNLVIKGELLMSLSLEEARANGWEVWCDCVGKEKHSTTGICVQMYLKVACGKVAVFFCVFVCVTMCLCEHGLVISIALNLRPGQGTRRK